MSKTPWRQAHVRKIVAKNNGQTLCSITTGHATEDTLELCVRNFIETRQNLGSDISFWLDEEIRWLFVRVDDERHALLDARNQFSIITTYRTSVRRPKEVQG